jgi:tryptophanyl-tRNA synthetase
MKKVFSGFQPSGNIHLGNYFGSIANCAKLQETHDCTFMVMNYHALTSSTILSKDDSWNMIKQLIALGINPNNLSIQSLVPEHTELCWILNNFCSFGELQRMTQFKDKTEISQSIDKNATVSVGLFDYPVLQAADIIIHGAEYIPVGKDQEQHLELARNIAERFNRRTGKEICIVPKTLFTEIPKVMSLADPSRKMSKSLGEKHYISAFEEEKSLVKKIKTAVTDLGDDIKAPMSAGVTNLLEILKAFSNTSYNYHIKHYDEGLRKYGEIKTSLLNILKEFVKTNNRRLETVENDFENHKECVISNSLILRKTASEKLREIKDTIGII